MGKDSRMGSIAFIPVRGGSKSIPLKNIKPLCGRPLVYWTAKAACGCKGIDRVFISTDSGQIREAVESFGLDKVTVVSRSAETAGDTASTESAMLEFAGQHDFEDIVLIQATSPLLASSDLDRGLELYGQPGCDSVFSAVRRYQFLWADGPDGTAHPQNYDISHRPRRQEYGGYLIENGAFYITSRERLLATKNRISGRIKAVEMDADAFFEIDEPGDWAVMEALMEKKGIGSHK